MEVAFSTMQSAGRSGALGTGRHAFGGPGDRRGPRGRRKRISSPRRRRRRKWEAPEIGGVDRRVAEAESESAPEERDAVGGPDAGRTECFPFLCFISFGGRGRRRSGSPTRIDNFDLGLDMDICKSPPLLPWPFGLHIAGYWIQEDTHNTVSRILTRPSGSQSSGILSQPILSIAQRSPREGAIPKEERGWVDPEKSWWCESGKR